MANVQEARNTNIPRDKAIRFLRGANQAYGPEWDQRTISNVSDTSKVYVIYSRVLDAPDTPVEHIMFRLSAVEEWGGLLDNDCPDQVQVYRRYLYGEGKWDMWAGSYTTFDSIAYGPLPPGWLSQDVRHVIDLFLASYAD